MRLSASAIITGLVVAFFASPRTSAIRADELPTYQADLLIVGGTESACAAAVQAARMGVGSIILVNDIGWLGGQFTSQAVGAIDEDRGVDKRVPFPRSGIFKEVMDAIEKSNLAKYGSTNAGNAWTANTTVRPAEGERVFRALLAPYVQSGQVKILENAYPVEAHRAAPNTLSGLTFASATDDRRLYTINARLTIDASEWGEAIKLSGAAYEFGPDLRDQYGEPNAPVGRKRYPITDLNPITYCLVVEETDNYGVISRPPHFDDRSFYLTTDRTEHDYKRLAWPFPPHRPFNPPWSPDGAESGFYRGNRSVYSQRRLVDSYGLKLRPAQQDVILLCWTIQDYPLDVHPAHVVAALEETEPGASKKNLVELSRKQRQIVFEDAKQHSLGMLYHLQTTVHDRMADRSHSFQRFALSREFGTPDNLPPKPYVRESLRLKAAYMMREQDLHENWRKGKAGPDQFAPVMYYDGIAGWQFPFDFHPTGRMFLPDAGASGPWQSYIKKGTPGDPPAGRTWGTLSDRALVPLRSLIPERIDGLLGAQLNLGFSSIVSSAVRLHPHCLAVGQAAGAAAAVSLRRGIAPRAIPHDLNLLNEVRRGLCARTDGAIPLMLWPFRDLEPDQPEFAAVNLLAAEQMLSCSRQEVDFRPQEPATDLWRRTVADRSVRVLAVESLPALPGGELTRGEFARHWWECIADLPRKSLQRHSADDADGDGTPDSADAAPYDDRLTTIDANPDGRKGAKRPPTRGN